jgi:hypothetical protein
LRIFRNEASFSQAGEARVFMSSSARSARRELGGIALAWFLLFPSLGIVQKYFGTRGAAAYLSVGSLLLICGALNGVTSPPRCGSITSGAERQQDFLALGLAFVVLPGFRSPSPLGFRRPASSAAA